MDSLSLFLSCFKWSVLSNGQLEFTFHFPKRCHSPFFRITEYQVSFPGLSDYGISNKFHSPVYRITEYQTRFIPRFIGISNKCLSPVCRITEGHSSSIFLIVSSPSISDNEASLNFNFLKKIVIYRCHPPACLVKGCH